MHQVKKHIGIRIFFLALFLSYFADFTFFTHTHIVNGTTIVHSHFYKGFSSSKPNNTSSDHTHSDKALTLISQLNAWTAIIPSTPEIQANLFIQFIVRKPKRVVSSPQFTFSYFQLRAPPSAA